METTPDELWSPDAVDPYNLVPNLAAMQDTVQDAISSVRLTISYFSGTDAQRVLHHTSGAAENGDMWTTTDTNYTYRYISGAWKRVVECIGGIETVYTDGDGYATVSHGLGKTPDGVTAAIIDTTPVIGNILKINVLDFTSTTFRVRIYRLDTTNGFGFNTVTFSFVAVG